MEHEPVALIVHETFADEREPLAGRTARDQVDLAVPRARGRSHETPYPHARRRERVRLEWRGHVCAQHLRARKVELVRRRVYRVVLDRSHDIEAGLFEAEGQPSRAGEQINCDGAAARRRPRRVAAPVVG